LPHPPAGGGDVVTRARPLTPESGLSAPRAVGAFGQVQFLSRRSAAAARSAKDPPPARLTDEQRARSNRRAGVGISVVHPSQRLGSPRQPSRLGCLIPGALSPRQRSSSENACCHPPLAFTPLPADRGHRHAEAVYEATRSMQGMNAPRNVSRRRGPARPPSRPTSSRRNGRSTGYYAAPSR